jgi:dTDP-4-dehydrorhamnose 3,5-epimerase
MKPVVEQTGIPGVLILKPKIFWDERGDFRQLYHEDFIFRDLGIDDFRVTQINMSRSKRSVLRGLHFQDHYAPLAKLIYCTKGTVYDVIVDLRAKSPTFGKWVGIRLSETNGSQVFAPVGTAHGFVVLSDEADVTYLQNDFYTPNSERTLKWNDPDLAIDWPGEKPFIMSYEDEMTPLTWATYKAEPEF